MTLTLMVTMALALALTLTLTLGRHRHGADDITAGERLNLIVWARNSAFRAAAAFNHIEPDGYPKEPYLEP